MSLSIVFHSRLHPDSEMMTKTSSCFFLHFPLATMYWVLSDTPLSYIMLPFEWKLNIAGAVLLYTNYFLLSFVSKI